MTTQNMHVQHPRATWLNPNTGKLIDAQALMHNMARQEVVLLGETHDIAEIHRWQMHVIAALHTLRPNMMVGFEMFPKRLQPVLDEWVDGQLDTETFIKKSEWVEVWGFPADIYLPIFHFCRQNKVRMLALNCARALVTRVGKEGWESVPEEERDGLTPSAPATEAYADYLSNLMNREGMPERPQERFIRAQQTWDRAFACNIVYALNDAKSTASVEDKAPLIVGVIGRGHMEYQHGTPYQLNDLGIQKIGVLLTSDKSGQNINDIKEIGDAIYRIDTPEPRAERIARPSTQPAPREVTT